MARTVGWSGLTSTCHWFCKENHWPDGFVDLVGWIPNGRDVFGDGFVVQSAKKPGDATRV